jgi:AcrR family transcriptional regulator
MQSNTQIATQAEVGGGRKSAYVARNRGKILRAAQEVLAEHGPESTIESVSERAEIAISTIYKHFENRDALFHEAMAGAMIDWETWAFAQVDDAFTPLKRLITPIRLLMRLGSTHPAYATMIANNPAVVAHALPAVSARMNANIYELVKQGILKIDDIEIRLRNFRGAILQAFQHQLQHPQAELRDADKAIELALAMLALPAEEAKALCADPIHLH